MGNYQRINIETDIQRKFEMSSALGEFDDLDGLSARNALFRDDPPQRRWRSRAFHRKPRARVQLDRHVDVIGIRVARSGQAVRVRVIVSDAAGSRLHPGPGAVTITSRWVASAAGRLRRR